jgi:riboflavin transporter FmnP
MKEFFMKNTSVRKLAFAGVFLALAIVLPFLTLQMQQLGNKLLPMHLPILLCGFICGWPYGLAVGFVAPLMRSMLFGAPPMMPVAIAMAFELAAYGFATGLFYRLLPKRNIFVYASLVLSMIVGRIVWGLTMIVLLGINGGSFTWTVFMTSAWVNAIPGIILQLILVPLIIVAFRKAGLIDLGNRGLSANAGLSDGK